MDLNPTFGAAEEWVMETLSQGSHSRSESRRNAASNNSNGHHPNNNHSSSSSAGSTTQPPRSAQVVDDAVRRLGYRLSIQAHGEGGSSSGSSTVLAGGGSRSEHSLFQHDPLERGFAAYAGLPLASGRLTAVDETTPSVAASSHRSSKVARMEYSQSQSPPPPTSSRRESSRSILRKLTLECKDRFAHWADKELRQRPRLSPHRHAFAQMGLADHNTHGGTSEGLLPAVLEGHSDSATSASQDVGRRHPASVGSHSISTKDTLASSTHKAGGLPHLPRGKCLTHPSEPVANHGHDNVEGNFIVYENDVISVSRKNLRTIHRKNAATGVKLRSADYRIVAAAGQGTFAQVFSCWHVQSAQHVALKIVKNKPAYTRQAAIEIDIFQALQEEETTSNKRDFMVNLISFFMHENHLCLVFELLGLNLYEVLKRRQFRGLPLTIVRDICRQSVEGLRDLSRKNVVHCDLKPENILFVSTTTDPVPRSESATTPDAGKIKLIDFGSACFEGYTAHTYIQSRFYRCPEVLLGLPYDSAIDMWSLGCVAAELFVGLPILPGVHEHDQVVRISEMIGHIPDWMLDQGAKSSKYYVKFVPPPVPSLAQWRLKTPVEYLDALSPGEIEKKGGLEKMKKQPGNRYFKRTKLSDILVLHGQGSAVTDKDLVPAFVHFLYGILDPDPWKRWTAFQAAQHPFITGELHLLRPKTDDIEMNPKDENQANLELEWYWPSPWDPAVCRRKLLNVQKIREKQQSARRSVLSRQHGSGSLKAPALQHAHRLAVPPDNVGDEGAIRSSSPPNQISSSDSTNASQQILLGTNPDHRAATERPLVSSSWNVQGPSNAPSSTHPAALPNMMLPGPQSFQAMGLTPTHADLAMALERPGVVPGTYGLGSSASHSTSTSQTRSTPSDVQFAPLYNSYQLPHSAYGSMNDSIGSLGFDPSIPTTPSSMIRNPDRAYLPANQIPMAPMNAAGNAPFMDAQQFAFYQQQQQMALLQQQQQLGLFPAAQPLQPAQFMVPQQQPIMLANAPNGGFYYVMTSPTGQPIILQPVGTLNPPDMYPQGFAAGMTAMGGAPMNAPPMGPPNGMPGLPVNPSQGFLEHPIPPHMSHIPQPQYHPQQQYPSRSSRHAPRHPRRSGTSM